MITKEMQDRLNRQLNVELYASYIYLSMAAYCKSIAYNGFASWFSTQSDEERGHAMKIYSYLLDQDAAVKLQAIDQPPSEFKSLLDVIEQTLAHEQKVTKLINELAGAAQKENDFATATFLHWFITEQIEEEATVRDILDQLKRIKDSNEGLMILDRELGSRRGEGAEESAS